VWKQGEKISGNGHFQLTVCMEFVVIMW
jgi:hypothetical protein